MMRRSLGLITALSAAVLFGCAPASPLERPAPEPTPAPTPSPPAVLPAQPAPQAAPPQAGADQPVAVLPPSAGEKEPTLESVPPPAPATARADDQCGALAMQSLVGKFRSAIPVPVDPSRRRVACTNCPITQDYRPDRLNIFFDATSGVIKEVKCG